MKNTTPHCPGPWKVSGTSIQYIDHGRWLIVARASNEKFTPEGNAANARLIAAAPELLSALQDVKEWILRDEESLDFGQVSMSSEMLNERFQNVRDAISRATGGEA